MSDEGGEQQQLAPVIPLFGRSASQRQAADGESSTPVGPGRAEAAAPVRPLGDGPDETDSIGAPSRARQDVPAWNSTWADSGTSSGGNGVASLDRRGPSDRHPARGGAKRATPVLRALHSQDDPTEGDRAPDPAHVREGAEELLVRKLRSRSLSISEARMVLKGYEHDGARLESGAVDDVLDDFCRRGYLDDALLAGQLVASGVERKGQGRVALSRALAQRGIPRDVIDAALDELPDDDAERALEYARTKARGLSRLDGDTALRRLVGQLSRRGYNGSVAMRAAKTALAETSSGRPSSGVRFVDSD